MLSILGHHNNKSLESSQVAGAFQISAEFQSTGQEIPGLNLTAKT